MRFQQFPPKALAFVVVTIAFALLSVGILTGESAIGDRREDRQTNGIRHRPPRFTVMLQFEEIGIHGVFTEVSGLGSESEVLEFRDGSDPNIVRKIPGALKWSDITLKRGFTGDPSLWNWRRLVESGNIADARTNGRLTLLDQGNPIATWQIFNAWPSKITGPQLKDDGNDIAIEELVIVHEGMMLEG